MEDEIRETIEKLNQSLGDAFPWTLDVVDPRELKLLEKNARYMLSETFNTLVGNVKGDGNLHSVPLCHRQADGSLLVLSGNHRVQAAAQAGIEHILILVIDRELSRDEAIAIQLSHNAIDGKDDQVLLAELWAEIGSVDMKLYAGLDDETIKKLETMEFDTIAEASVDYKMMTFLFLPEEVDRLKAAAEEIDRVTAQSDGTYLLSREHYAKVFDAIVNTKEQYSIVNTPTALMKMVEIVEERLAADAAAASD